MITVTIIQGDQSSGKTTLIDALANKLSQKKKHNILEIDEVTAENFEETIDKIEERPDGSDTIIATQYKSLYYALCKRLNKKNVKLYHIELFA